MRRLLSTVLAAALLASACTPEEEPALPPRPVLSMIAKPVLAPATRLVGTIEPRYTTDLGFRVLGRITARSVEVGDFVKAGEVVATVDPKSHELAVASAEADVASAEAQLANARSAEQRQRSLFKIGRTPQSSVDDAEQTRTAAEAALAQSQAALQKAREQLDYTQLKSDFAGVVTATSADVGQVVADGQSVLTVARPEVREAVIDVGEEIADGLHDGAAFEVALQMDPSTQVAATVREIAPQSDTATRTRRVRLTLAAPPETFRLGATIVASPVSAAVNRLIVPASAVLDRDGATFVFVAEGTADSARVALRPVLVRAIDDARAEVTAGLAAGDRVVTAGIHSLTDGQRIRLYEDARS
jgi:RND family efflux transporter MFP subunit